MITYEKGAAPTQQINLNNSVKTDLRGLGTGVGGFSNLATIMYAMIAQFDPETQKEQRAELRRRIKLLREIVGQEIDRIKGTAAPVVPKEWKTTEKIQPEDTDAEKAEKYKHNSMVISKKPYFFRYLYPELNKQYKQYESSYNQMCLTSFGLKLKQVLAKPNKTEAEKRVVRLYYKYSPLITSPCTMNLLCRELEDADFDISYKRPSRSMLPTFEDEFEVDEAKLATVKQQYQKYNSSKQINILNRFFDYDENFLVTQRTADFRAIRFKIADSILMDIRNSLASAEIHSKELLFYANVLSKSYKKFNWAFVWDVLDTQILSFIPQGVTKAPVNINSITMDEIRDNPQYADAPAGEYLGQVYLLKDVTKDKWATEPVEEEDQEPPIDESVGEKYDGYYQTELYRSNDTNEKVSETSEIEPAPSEIEPTLSETSEIAAEYPDEPIEYESLGNTESDLWDSYLEQLGEITEEENRYTKRTSLKKRDRDKNQRRKEKWN